MKLIKSRKKRALRKGNEKLEKILKNWFINQVVSTYE